MDAETPKAIQYAQKLLDAQARRIPRLHHAVPATLRATCGGVWSTLPDLRRQWPLKKVDTVWVEPPVSMPRSAATGDQLNAASCCPEP
jgi:hypothetical protein